jgi:hypothetical protein
MLSFVNVFPIALLLLVSQPNIAIGASQSYEALNAVALSIDIHGVFLIYDLSWKTILL